MLPRKRGMWCPFVNGHCQALPDESGPASFCRPSLIRTLFVGFCADKCAPGWGSLSDQKDGRPRQLLNRGKFSATNLDGLGFHMRGRIQLDSWRSQADRPAGTNLLPQGRPATHSMVMADLLRLHWHRNPVQQTARPGFRRGQLPVVAKVGDDTGEDDRSWASECGPKPGWRGAMCRRSDRTRNYDWGGKSGISG